ncbi:unnamed protein product, partial [Polarella glacialis]
SPEELLGGQFADLQEIANSLGGGSPWASSNVPSPPAVSEDADDVEAFYDDDYAGEAEPPPGPGRGIGGLVMPGVGILSGPGRRSKKGNSLEVASFAPAGANVFRAKLRPAATPQRRHFERVFGGRHPASRRIHRRILRLEKELKLEKATEEPLSERPPGRRRWAAGKEGTKDPLEARVRAASPQARAAILWRRLR